MESDPALPLGRPASGRRAWPAFLESPRLVGAGFAVAAILTAAAVGLGSSPTLSGPLGPASPLVLALVGADLVLILALGSLIGWRLAGLADKQARDAGARLHLRFVTLFALAAVAPALVVALFFGVLVTRGVESWFNTRVETVVENSATVARSYVDEQGLYIRDHAASMARELNNAGPSQLASSPVAFSLFLGQQASDNGFTAAYVIDRGGRILASAHAGIAPEFLLPPAKLFAAADPGDEVEANSFEGEELFRALYRLRGYPDAYLYVVRPVTHGVFSHLRETSDSVAAYRQAKESRGRIQAGFAFIYAEAVLVVLLGAVSFGMSAADSIAGPVARLVQASGKIAGGDLTVRVDTRSGPDEIGVLSRAFNRMTSDLETQQKALMTAHKEAESRRQFVETMLFGLSAGVIGLDRTGRASVVNRQAAALLEPAGDAVGRPLTTLAPEFSDAVERAARSGQEVEEDLDIVRGGEARRLRLRVSHSPEGLVLTFDDISRLVAAQRNAAWRDVARRIAHEIRNPLTPIQLSAERLRRKYRKEIATDLETFDRCTDTIVRQVGDIGRMVDEFSAFARMPAPVFAEHDAGELLRQAVFAQRVADPATSIEIVEPSGPAPVVCDGRMVGQALANLLKNAGEAILARRQDPAAPPGRITACLSLDARQASFEIEDNGVGLPAKDRGRLTEPYVTTREKGTGLGLAIVKRIMEEHGGDLQIGDAAERPGARMVLRLPLGRPIAPGVDVGEHVLKEA
ncbi:MAG: PAS domain-containing sensor histidine kinase [Caulobacteraceae bacterium]|nr:PAS domain-containing sensor histidine kinase [Caulobacteraceae bacterium]